MLDSGYAEQVIWVSMIEAEFKSALSNFEGMRALAQTAVRLAENLGAGNQVIAAGAVCEALASDHEWQALLEAAPEALRMIRERGAQRMLEPRLLGHIATAQLELGDREAARKSAQEGVALMRESKSAWYPRCYTVLARAQLALGEPAADIVRTLDEYAAMLERTESHLYEGVIHELRARLAEREGDRAAMAAEMDRAYDSYASLGMTAQAARVKEAIGPTR
jgi:ATP/maltotriose-dependent transcriptional regulator MalT